MYGGPYIGEYRSPYTGKTKYGSHLTGKKTSFYWESPWFSLGAGPSTC